MDPMLIYRIKSLLFFPSPMSFIVVIVNVCMMTTLITGLLSRRCDWVAGVRIGMKLQMRMMMMVGCTCEPRVYEKDEGYKSRV